MSTPRRGSVSQRQQSQPKTFKLTAKALLSLPYRLCNPPPAIGKVRSCAVTPVFSVKLEDVLNRKHLPPLGLKDFEEWLLYVEKCPENLYFALWLKEYTVKYNQWSLESKARRPSLPPPSTAYRVALPAAPASSSLALFYARAKQTFLTPKSPYELKISSDILSPFHTSNFGSPHPDPAVFADVAIETQTLLRESLDRMVVAAYTNVGNDRALCGMIGGITIMLLGSIAPLVVNFLHGRDRWLRLLAIPSLWLGLTVLLASLHGVCMMVYVFGDLRQLRKFELSRPPISRPQPLTSPRLRPVISSPYATSGAPIQPVILPIVLAHAVPLPQSSHLTIPDRAATRGPSRARTVSSSSSSSGQTIASSSGSSSSGTEGHSDTHHGALTIEIGPAFFDERHVEGPATDFSFSRPRNHSFPSSHHVLSTKENLSVDEFTPTASFIHPYDPLCDEDFDATREMTSEERQALGPFDFDLLPKKGYRFPERSKAASMVTDDHGGQRPSVVEREGATVGAAVFAGLRSPRDILGRTQSSCNQGRVADTFTSQPEKRSSLHMPPTISPQTPSPRDTAAQFKRVNSVPAFASPFTRVLNPVVTRAQWEIVVRSALFAGLACWGFVGALLAIPARR